MAEIELGTGPTKFTPSSTAQQITMLANTKADEMWLTVESADSGVIAWAREETEAHSVSTTAREQLPAGRWPLTRPHDIGGGLAWSVWIILVSGTCTCYVQPVRRGL